MHWHGKTSNSNNIAGSVEHCAAKQEELDPDENENGHEVEKENGISQRYIHALK